MLKTLLNIFKSYICLFCLLPVFSSVPIFLILLASCAMQRVSFVFVLGSGFFVVTFAYFFPLFNKIKRLKHDGDFSRKCWLTFGAMLRHFVKQIHTTQKFHFFITSIFLFVMTIFSAMFLAFIWIMKAIRGNRRVRQFIPNQMKLGICKKKSFGEWLWIFKNIDCIRTASESNDSI